MLKNVESFQIQKIRSIKINFGLGKQGLSLSCHVSEPRAKRLSPQSLPRSGVPKGCKFQKGQKENRKWKNGAESDELPCSPCRNLGTLKWVFHLLPNSTPYTKKRKSKNRKKLKKKKEKNGILEKFLENTKIWKM